MVFEELNKVVHFETTLFVVLMTSLSVLYHGNVARREHEMFLFFAKQKSQRGESHSFFLDRKTYIQLHIVFKPFE